MFSGGVPTPGWDPYVTTGLTLTMSFTTYCWASWCILPEHRANSTLKYAMLEVPSARQGPGIDDFLTGYLEMGTLSSLPRDDIPDPWAPALPRLMVSFCPMASATYNDQESTAKRVTK